ncbi:MAG: histidine kinase [Acidobacteria bacterium]|nr:MAG: histidine kinase [Acidobacteriota bacterium]
MTIGEGADRPYQRLSSRELLLIFLFWTSLATVSAVSRLLDPRGFGFRVMSPAGPIALAFIEAWIWALFTPLIFWLSSRVSLARSKWIVRIPMIIVVGLAVAMAVYFVLDVARDVIFENALRRGGSVFAPFRDLGRFRFVNQLLVFFSILAAGFAREYFLRDQSRQRESVELQAQLAEARLDALRMQVNPHFLFNTLNAISALVERDPAGVRRMIARLSELLRHTIDRNRSDEVPLREELAFIRRYIEIMEIRFQGRLRVRMEIENEILDALVPDFILQPIVENALEHGVSRAAGAGEITIAARRDGDRVILTVRDNGPGISENVGSGGVGVANTRERIEHLYGDQGKLMLAPAAEGGTIAEILIPFRAAGASGA